MTFNKVEITSHYSIFGLYVREGFPQGPNLLLLSTGLITRGGEKADVYKEEGEVRAREGEEESERVTRQGGV